MIRRTAVRLAVVAALALCAGFAFAQDNTEAPECIKGTVTKVAETALYFSLPDEAFGKKESTVLLDRATKYFDGTKQVTREALQPGHIVLIHCKMEGKDRKAALVRIIGGKKL